MGRATRLRAKMKALARSWSPFVSVPITEELIRMNPLLANCHAIFANSRYEVQLFNCPSPVGGVVQMLVARHGNIERITWEELQRVKNEIFGENYSAVELYPPSDTEWKVTREIRVLWILPLDYVPPFGLHLSGAWGWKGD